MMNSKSYDPEKTEVWALGVTLYAMLSGKLPFEEELPSKLLKQMLSNDYE
jgi:serine/threonine protein kinase